MKKIYNFLLMLTVCLCSMGTANAARLDVDLSALPATSENTTWSWDSESQSGVFAWSETSYNSTQLFGKGDYSAYTTLHLETTAGTLDHFRLILKFTNGKAQVTKTFEVGTLDLSWADLDVSSTDLLSIETIRLSGTNWEFGTGDINVKKVYLEGPDVNYIEAYRVYETPAGAVDLKNLTGTNTNWSNSVEYPKELAVQGAAFGDGDGSNESTHVSIDGYDYLSFVVTKASDLSAAVRVWIWDDVNKKVVTLYLYPESQYASVENWETENRITGPGVYVVKVSGYKYLKGVKAANNWGAPSVTVGLAYASKGEKPQPMPETHKYMLIGSDPGSVSLTAALADADAVLMDASNVKAESLELTSANPNCIFVAKEGVLGNASNVAVDGVIAKMVVTDGYPMEVPASTSATAASYSRTMANQYGTICLPFAVESNDAVKFYTLGEISGDVLTINEVTTLPAGTPGIVEKVSGEAITCTGAGALSNPVNVDGALKFYGSFEKKTIAAADHTGNIYAISNNKFVQAENQINLPAFRAFFAAESGEAKLRIAPNEDVTAINNVAGEATSLVVGVYGMDGAQRNSLQKGMNVVKMSNGSVRKVYVK